jgi:putative transposase
LIKAAFSRNLPRIEWRSDSRKQKGERGIWQRRYWEHMIRNDEDYARHVDYIHINPVKHGHATHPLEWPYSLMPFLSVSFLYFGGSPYRKD